jgi:hypothetical protein
LVASNTGDDEQDRPTASAMESGGGALPTIRNLDRVAGIKPLRSEAGALPSSAAAADVPAGGGQTNVENAP